MPALDIARVFVVNKELRAAFRECRQCMGDVEKAGRSVVISPPVTDRAFMISATGFPVSMYLPQRNFFSTLFQAVYGFLKIPKPRRLLYGRINYLFRIWVTSADNLLDDEDKVPFPIRMPVDSRVMRQVVAIMAADRILARFLDDAIQEGVITREEARGISDRTLQVLLPSAAEEASEEKGIVKRPRPEYVLDTIHHLKTSLLFHLPLFGPRQVEKALDEQVFAGCREGLGRFGLGCQLLDDLRDLARDHIEQRHNYALSLLAHHHPAAFRRLQGMGSALSVERSIFSGFRDELAPVARLAQEHMTSGLRRLDDCGLGLGKVNAGEISSWMFRALDVDKARGWLS